MKIPPNIIRELHNLDCEDVAKRFGIETKGHMCHCFKHEDRVASLGFRRNHWKCFSCDVGGDAITLAQEYYSVSFTEACVILANEYRISIPDVNNRTQKWKDSFMLLRQRVRPVDATMVFDREVAEYIVGNTFLSQTGLEFLENQRKINSDVIATSQIHSLDDTINLKQELIAKFGVERLIKCKVLRENTKSLTIDTPSLIIPYYDENEQLISLQTRYLGEDNPDFHIARFKRICNAKIRLYNMPVLKNCRGENKLFITEGITDCLAMQSYGYNAVAIPSATSFPLEDLSKLKKYNLFMMSDQDSAGYNSYIRLYRLMLRYDCVLKHVSLPAGINDYSEYYLHLLGNS